MRSSGINASWAAVTTGACCWRRRWFYSLLTATVCCWRTCPTTPLVLSAFVLRRHCMCVCEGHARKWETQKPSGMAGSVYARAAFCSNFYISALPSLLKIRDASPALHALNGLFKAWPINRAGPSKKSTSGSHVPGWSNSTSRWHPTIPPTNYPSEMQWICLQPLRQTLFFPQKNFLLFFHHLSMLVARPWSHNNFGGKLFPISRPLWPATAFGYFRFRLVYLCFLPPYIPIAIHSAIWHSGSSSISHRNCMLCTFCCHGGFIFQFQHSQVFFCSFGSISVCPVKLALKRWSLSN